MLFPLSNVVCVISILLIYRIEDDPLLYQLHMYRSVELHLFVLFFRFWFIFVLAYMILKVLSKYLISDINSVCTLCAHANINE